MMNTQTIVTNTNLFRRIIRSPWLIWGLGAALFFAEYFARVAPGVITNELIRAFDVNMVALGGISAFFYYAYVPIQIPVGMLMDRFGPHRILTVTALICTLGTFLFATAQNVEIAYFARFLMGFGAAFAFIGALKLASIWFPPSKLGLLAGMTQALGMLGAAVGEAPMAYAVHELGWRHTMHSIGFLFLFMSIAIGLIVRDGPKRKNGTDKPRYQAEVSLLQSVIIVLRNKQTWINGLYVGMLYAPTAAFGEFWGVAFLHNVYHIDTETAASAVGLIFIGWAVGGPIAGWISDKIQRRKPVMYGSALLGILLLGSVILLPLPVPLVFVALFLYGMTNTGVAISYAVAGEINRKGVAGTSIAFANMTSVIVGAIFQPIIGWFLQLEWNGIKLNGIPEFSTMDYRIVLCVLPVFLVLALFFAYFVKETHCTPVAS